MLKNSFFTLVFILLLAVNSSADTCPASFTTFLPAVKKAEAIHKSHLFGTDAEIGGDGGTWRLLTAALGGLANTAFFHIVAHDKDYSNYRYPITGKKTVSSERLDVMLKVDMEELLKVKKDLNGKRPFAYANTVVTREDKPGYGWVGLRLPFNLSIKPNEEPVQIFYDFRMQIVLNSKQIEEQQNVLGTLGVNLIYHADRIVKDPRNQEEISQLISAIKDEIAGKFIVNVFSVRPVSMDFTAKSRSVFLAKKLFDNKLTNKVVATAKDDILKNPKDDLVDPADLLWERDGYLFEIKSQDNVNQAIEKIKRFAANTRTSAPKGLALVAAINSVGLHQATVSAFQDAGIHVLIHDNSPVPSQLIPIDNLKSISLDQI